MGRSRGGRRGSQEIPVIQGRRWVIFERVCGRYLPIDVRLAQKQPVQNHRSFTTAAADPRSHGSVPKLRTGVTMSRETLVPTQIFDSREHAFAQYYGDSALNILARSSALST